MNQLEIERAKYIMKQVKEAGGIFKCPADLRADAKWAWEVLFMEKLAKLLD